MSRSDVDYLKHIRDELQFLAHESTTVDSASFLKDEVRQRYPDVDWRAMAGMRDQLIHNYFGVDHEIVWDVASNLAPALLGRVSSIISNEED